MMIYLIDDRITRQKELGWNKENFDKEYLITPIYTFQQLNILKSEMLSAKSVVLIHESFQDLSSTTNNSFIQDFIESLNEYVLKEENFYLVYFSGSKKVRKLLKNKAFLPVEILYENLSIFSKKASSGNINLGYLTYGENIEIEKDLYEKLVTSNNSIEDYKISDDGIKNIVFKTAEEEIQDPFVNATNEIIFEDEITDAFLDQFINENLNTEYDNIFLPLIFGNTRSDYNGLRFALHIRCTNSLNQLKPIFIYSFIDLSYLLNSEYFGVLKTKNIFFIDYTKNAFENALQKNIEILSPTELAFEIKKVKLSAPQDKGDNHTIANEWAIFRWAKVVQAEDKSIDKVFQNISTNLYYKYLQTIYPISQSKIMSEKDLQIEKNGNPKILLIDDEADKGWYEVFCKILFDINGVKEFCYLGDELKGMSQNDIINLSVAKIKQQDTDIVILDFRLHENDFAENLSKVSGLRILKEIKQINPGIQVIFFSATNKIWNLQALQNAGADGFIVKEAPENSVDSKFTEEVIKAFIDEIDKTNRRKFLKNIFISLNNIEENVYNCDFVDDTNFDSFLKQLISQITIIRSATKKINLSDKSSIDIVFLNCFNFLESFKNEFLNYNYNSYTYSMGIEEIEMIGYKRENGTFKNIGKFSTKNSSEKPSFFITTTNIIVNYFNLCDVNDVTIKNLDKIAQYRNDFIHSTKDHFKPSEIHLILELMEVITSDMKE